MLILNHLEDIYHNRLPIIQRRTGFDLATIKEAIEEGAAEYDLLHGDESYKFLWASRVRPLSRIELYPPGVIGRIHRDSVVAVAATKRILKRALYAPLNR